MAWAGFDYTPHFPSPSGGSITCAPFRIASARLLHAIMTRLLACVTAIASAVALIACQRRAVSLTCTPPPRRGTGFERRVITTNDSLSRPLTIRVKSIDRTPGPLSNAIVRWAPISGQQLSPMPRVSSDSAEFSLGIVAPGSYVVHVFGLGYQPALDTLVVQPTTRAIEYGLWEEPLCLSEHRRASRSAASNGR